MGSLQLGPIICVLHLGTVIQSLGMAAGIGLMLQGSCTVLLELGNSGRELRCEGCLDVGFSSCAAPTFYRKSRYFKWVGKS